MLCALRKYPSVLRDTSNENMSTFSIEKMNSEIQQKDPFLHSVLQHSVKNSTLGIVMTPSVAALKFRNNQLSALNHIVAQILDKGGATNEVWTYLCPIII